MKLNADLFPFMVHVFDGKDAIIDNQDFFDKAAALIRSNFTNTEYTIMFFCSKSGDSNIAIVGPEDIAKWLGDRCPEEVFSDNDSMGGDEGETVFVENWFWNQVDGKVYVSFGDKEEVISYDEWIEPTVKKIDEPDWVEKIPMVAVYKFCSGNKYGGNKPKEYIKENWQRFFKPISNVDWIAGMADILKWEGDLDHEETILKFLVEKHLDKAIEYWA